MYYFLINNQNITIKGITFENLNECHFIELDASKNVKILNCTFRNAEGYNKNREAINITIIQDIQEGLCVQQLLIKLKISIWEEH